MATQEPAVNGNKVTFNNVALRDIRMQAVQTSDFLQPGRTVDLVVVAVNQSPDVTDRLVGITSDIGTVTVDRRRSTARRRHAVHRHARRPERGAGAPRVQQRGQGDRRLGQAHHNGLTYNFTFNFEKAGQASVMVPISAGLGPPQQI